jgi:hypothetical protein
MIGQRMQRAAECRCIASRAPLRLLSALRTQKEKASFGGLAGRKPQPQADERYRDPQDARSRAGDPLRAVGCSSTLWTFVGNYYASKAGAWSELVGLVQWEL